MKIDLFFSSGVASKLHKAKLQEVEDSLIEVLKHAPHMPEANGQTDDGRLPMTKAHMAYGQVS
jgi:hypothetical protein